MRARCPDEQPESVPSCDLHPGIAHCRKRVYAWALREGCPAADADDIAQEAALRLTRWPGAAARPQGRWLRRLSMQCLEAWRRKHGYWMHLEEEAILAPEPPEAELMDYIWRAIHRLPVKESLVFHRCGIEGAPGVQVAAELRLSPDYVHLLGFRARRQIRLEVERVLGNS